MKHLTMLEETARVIESTADCAIGYTAAQMVLKGLDGFKEDFMEHILHNRCRSNLDQPVPCVALCPAGVDIPGYIALTAEGRYADAVRLIRKDNPFPTACALVCEHPCESRCRRNMLDNPSTSAASSAWQLIWLVMCRLLSVLSRPESASPSSAAVRAVLALPTICS